MRRSFLLYITTTLLVVLFINFAVFDVFAEEAPVGDAVKSHTGYKDTRLNKELYTDPARYNNPSVSEQIIKVGMDYGREAVGWASFENTSGEGFIFGFYDEHRIFHAQRQTQVPVIFVNIVSQEYGHEKENGEWETGMEYCFQIVSGMDSSVLLSMDSSIEKLAIISADGSPIRYKDDVFHGGFECILSEDYMSIINYVGLEDYVKGVIPYEMSAYWPFEALRAQAVCARTYAVYNIDSYADYGFDLTDDTRSQVYRGTVDADEITDAAVDTTAYQLVRYKGEVCEIYYFSSDGGATEDGINVFSVDRPYLAGKPDPFEDAVNYTLRSWSFEKSGKDLQTILNKAGFEIGEVTGIYPSVSRSGNVIALRFSDEDGQSVLVEGRRCYTILGLHNCRFDVVRDGDVFSFTGSGWGHNCGMSQWGANAMADVYGYDYQDIIRFYFTGAYAA